MNQKPEYRVPEDAARYVALHTAAPEYLVHHILSRFIRWQAENPPVPSEADCQAWSLGARTEPFPEWWFRRCYLVPQPEPELPKDVEARLREADWFTSTYARDIARQAYKAGLEARK